MNRVARLGLLILILLICVGCDQAAKGLARATLASSPPVLLLHGIVRLEYTENAGSILSLGAGWPGEVRFLFFVVVTGIILVVALMLAVTMPRLAFMPFLGLALIAGGGAGNLLDRLYNHGLVVDFMVLGVGPLRTGIFNVADVAIMAGMAILILFGLRGRK